MADYIRKQIDVDGSYIFPYTHADAVLYTTQNNLDGITSGTETNVKAVLDALDNTYRRQDANILSLYNPNGKRGFLYQNGTTTTASMELPTQGNNFYVPTLKYDSSGNITTAWQTPASIAAAADLSGYLPLTGGTLTGDITVTKSSYSVLTGEAVVNGLTVKSNNITVGFGIGTGGVSRGIYDYNNSKWLIYSDGTNTNLPLGDTKVTGKVMVGTGAPNSYLGSTSATNIFLNNSSGSVLVCDAKVVRRGTAVSDVDLGSTTYPWRNLYVSGQITSSVADGTAPFVVTSKKLVSNLTSNYAASLRDPDYYASGNNRTSANISFGDTGLHYFISTTNLATGAPADQGYILHCSWDTVNYNAQLYIPMQNTKPVQVRQCRAGTWGNWYDLIDALNTQEITGEKTFTGEKRIKFKQSTATDKLGFTLYNNDGVETSYFEWDPAGPSTTLGCWRSANSTATQATVGFKQHSAPDAASYVILTPLPANAKTPLGLNTTIKTLYFPLQFKNGSTTVLTANTGVVDLSTLIPSYSTKNMSVNGTNYALYTSASSLPTIIAPTAYAGTGGYILATNANKNGLEWVAKPTSNVTTSAVVSSSATGTAQITTAQSNPYYNLIEGSTVARSIRFVAGTGISISAATDGQITITNTVGSSSITSVASILASTSTGTSAISGDTLDPYYNLIVNSAVNSSVQYKAGTNMAITADTNNVITFANTLNTMSKLTNDLFINGTQTAATGSWKGNLPANITTLYNGLTIFYRLPYAGSGNASLQLYAQDGTTAIGANCPVYAGNTRLTTHYPQYSIIPMTYYDGVWRANPYYYSNNQVTQSDTTTTNYRPILLGYQNNASYTGIPTTAVTNQAYKTTNAIVSPAEGRMYLSSDTASVLHGYFTRYSTSGHILGLAIGTDGVQRGLRDDKNDTWLCYCDDNTGESLKVPGTLIPQVINLAEHCQIAYDSVNQCINFTFT